MICPRERATVFLINAHVLISIATILETKSCCFALTLTVNLLIYNHQFLGYKSVMHLKNIETKKYRRQTILQ